MKKLLSRSRKRNDVLRSAVSKVDKVALQAGFVARSALLILKVMIAET